MRIYVFPCGLGSYKYHKFIKYDNEDNKLLKHTKSKFGYNLYTTKKQKTMGIISKTYYLVVNLSKAAITNKTLNGM